MEFAAASADFRRQGFCVVRSLLADDAPRLSSLVREYIARVVPSKSPECVFYDVADDPSSLKFIKSPGFREDGPGIEDGEAAAFLAQLDDNPRLLRLAEAVLGEAVAERPALGRGEFFAKAPGGVSRPTPPHQDNWYFGLSPPNVVTFWIAIDPIDESTGCLRYMPQDLASGRHANGQVGLLPHAPSSIGGFSQHIPQFGEADSALMQPQVLRPGDVIAHHGLTIHRADANTSADRARRAFGCVYRGVSCKVDQAAHDAYLQSLKDQALPGSVRGDCET